MTKLFEKSFCTALISESAAVHGEDSMVWFGNSKPEASVWILTPSSD